MNSRPVSVQLSPQQIPIRVQAKPHVPSTCEFAMFVKACRIYRRNLHSSNVEALGPAVGHTINQIRPRAVTTLPWKKNYHLGLLGATAIPGTSSLLLKHTTKNTILEGSKLSSTGKLSQSILSLPMSVGRFL